VSAAGPRSFCTSCRDGHPARHRPCPPRLNAAVACGSRDPAPRPAARRTSCHVRGGSAGTTTCPRWWPACGRRPDTCPGGSLPRTPAWHRHEPGQVCRTTAVRTPAVRTAVVPEAADGQAADRSCSLQPPLPFLKAGPAARQRHDGHRGTGLTLTARVARAVTAAGGEPYQEAVVRGTVPGTGGRSDSRTGPDPDGGSGLVIATAAMPIPEAINPITTTPRTTGHRGRSRRQSVWPAAADRSMAPGELHATDQEGGEAQEEAIEPLDVFGRSQKAPEQQQPTHGQAEVRGGEGAAVHRSFLVGREQAASESATTPHRGHIRPEDHRPQRSPSVQHRARSLADSG
jgi:hypothetical protein